MVVGSLVGLELGPTRTNPPHILLSLSENSGSGYGYGNYNYTMALVMDRPAMITDMSTRL